MRVVCAVVVCLSLGSAALAAATGQIRGTITDKGTGEPVIGASVLVVGTSSGAITDSAGNYAIGQLEPGEYRLKIDHFDYQSVDVPEAGVKSDAALEVNHALELGTFKSVRLTDPPAPDPERDDRVTTVEELLMQVDGVESPVVIRGSGKQLVKYVLEEESNPIAPADSIDSTTPVTVDELLSRVAGVNPDDSLRIVLPPQFADPPTPDTVSDRPVITVEELLAQVAATSPGSCHDVSYVLREGPECWFSSSMRPVWDEKPGHVDLEVTVWSHPDAVCDSFEVEISRHENLLLPDPSAKVITLIPGDTTVVVIPVEILGRHTGRVEVEVRCHTGCRRRNSATFIAGSFAATHLEGWIVPTQTIRRPSADSVGSPVKDSIRQRE